MPIPAALKQTPSKDPKFNTTHSASYIYFLR